MKLRSVSKQITNHVPIFITEERADCNAAECRKRITVISDNVFHLIKKKVRTEDLFCEPFTLIKLMHNLTVKNNF